MCSSTPNWTQFLDDAFTDGGFESTGLYACIIETASGVVTGTNPPYTIQDFLALYPKFGGPTVTPSPSGTATQGSPTITGVPSGSGAVATGNPITDSAGLFPDGTVVVSVGSGTITLSNNATGSGTTILTVWSAPLIPFVVLLAYISFASASLVQARWQEMWPVAMGLFIAHYATLWMRSDGTGASTAAQAAQQGLALGLQTSKSVGDVSVGYQFLTGLDSWGAFNLTLYGQQLITLAQNVGAGGMLIY